MLVLPVPQERRPSPATAIRAEAGNTPGVMERMPSRMIWADTGISTDTQPQRLEEQVARHTWNSALSLSSRDESGHVTVQALSSEGSTSLRISFLMR